MYFSQFLHQEWLMCGGHNTAKSDNSKNKTSITALLFLYQCDLSVLLYYKHFIKLLRTNNIMKQILASGMRN